MELVEGGGLPSAQIIDISLQSKPKGSPDFGSSNLAHRIVRVRALGDVQIGLEEIWLDSRFVDSLHVEEISESLYVFYKDALNLTISKIEDSLSAAPVPQWKPHQFNMKKGDLAGYIERVSCDQFDKPAEFSKTWFNPKHARYVTRF